VGDEYVDLDLDLDLWFSLSPYEQVALGRLAAGLPKECRR
jgi:hypothetical protein